MMTIGQWTDVDQKEPEPPAVDPRLKVREALIADLKEQMMINLNVPSTRTLFAALLWIIEHGGDSRN